MPESRPRLFAAFLLLILSGHTGTVWAQPEVMAWSNITGLRVDGYLLPVHSSLCVLRPDGSVAARTGRERQTNSYSRKGKVETVKVQLTPQTEDQSTPPPAWSLAGVQTVEDTGPGSARVEVEFTARTEADIAGAYFCLELPAELYSGGKAQLIDPLSPAAAEVSLAPGSAEQNEYLRATAGGIRFNTPRHQIEVLFNEPSEVLVRDDRRQNNYDIQVYLAILSGKAAANQVGKKSYALKVTGEVDKNPVDIIIDATRPGQLFEGLGGNFRLQNPKTDPEVIQYCLDNLRVAWGRVEMPWRAWHPNEDMDPLETARAGKAPPAVTQAMEMARRLAQKGMPVIVSAWFPPSWAVLGNAGGMRPPGGLRGRPLNPEKMERIVESLSGYLVYLKEKYGVEAVLFSFNESDLGIDVRQTAREHAELIKRLGPYMASQGLATKMLLGDTSDAWPVEFIQTAMHDPEAVKHIGAVSFHSWRGCTDEILSRWRDAARTLNVPLLVGEGSTDAAAYRYPQIFLEQSFALYEIDLYTRILAMARPKSILQWQLTADYSLLIGNGIFGTDGPLRPTQRFWNLKQLASTPQGSFALPVKCNRPALSCAAFGNISQGIYAIHVVNNGGARPATLSGLPSETKELRIWVTDSRRGMQEGARVGVSNGRAAFTLDATSYTTLISAP